MAKANLKSTGIRGDGEFATSDRSKARKYHGVREAKGGEFVTLKDGRKIVEPPPGGKLKKRDIERAVRTIASERKTAVSARS